MSEPDYIFDAYDTHLVCRKSPVADNVGSRFEFYGMGVWFVTLCRTRGKAVTVQYRDARDSADAQYEIDKQDLERAGYLVIDTDQVKP